MLSTTLVRSTPLSHGLVGATRLGSATLLARSSCRAFSSGHLLRNELNDKRAEKVATPPHRKSAMSKPKEYQEAETALSAVPSEVNTVNGDWVLFHPVYTPEELRAVQVLHRDAKTWQDKLAANLVRLARWGFDFVSRYKHKPIPPEHNMSLAELRKGGYLLDEKNWLDRILFLESIAGVPGMVAATLRHLRSLRLMRRDSGWIHTLLEEAENERMHLMTFMTIRNPSIFLRALILGAQGVFYNLFFLSYLVSPQTCHRFVGHLEEEAVLTYTRCIKDLEAGRIPEWENMPAPEIAIDYWRLPSDAKMVDVLYAVRSDETTHRFVNHSLANLNTKTDVNPFALREPSMHIKGNQIEFDRNEAAQYVNESYQLLNEEPKKK